MDLAPLDPHNPLSASTASRSSSCRWVILGIKSSCKRVNEGENPPTSPITTYNMPIHSKCTKKCTFYCTLTTLGHEILQMSFTLPIKNIIAKNILINVIK